VKDAVEKLGVKDFNLILNNGKDAGQVVGHLHLHILPRKEGDGFEIGA
jgi:histidine triad (HIT) family protein